MPHEICNLFAINYQLYIEIVVYFESISNTLEFLFISNCFSILPEICNLYRTN